MPDEVIVNILSFMPIQDAVKTVLLRRFGNLWTSVHSLIIDHKIRFSRRRSPDGSRDLRVDDRFNRFVHNVLILHKRPSIKKFYLCFKFANHYVESAEDVKVWLKFALDKQAKEIIFGGMYEDETDISIPQNFMSQSLVTLVLACCIIKPQTQVNLPSLKKLKLYDVEVCEETLDHFLSGCSSLKELDIEEPSCQKLGFSAPHIEKLSLVLEGSWEKNPFLLNFPILKSIVLDTNWLPEIIDCSCVRHIYIKRFEAFRFHEDDHAEDYHEMLITFWGKFKGAEVLQLSHTASEHALHTIHDLNLSEIRLKHVVLELKVNCQKCLFGIYQLMRGLKHLEELNIYTTKDFETSTELTPVDLSSPCVMPKLKIVTLHGYLKPWNRELHLVEFLLKNAVVLDKLVIIPDKNHLTTTEELKFLKRLSNCQRSSPSARVVFT